MIIWAFIGMLLGARAGSVYDSWAIYSADPLKILRIWEGGFPGRPRLSGLSWGRFLRLYKAPENPVLDDRGRRSASGSPHRRNRPLGLFFERVLHRDRDDGSMGSPFLPELGASPPSNAALLLFRSAFHRRSSPVDGILGLATIMTAESGERFFVPLLRDTLFSAASAVSDPFRSDFTRIGMQTNRSVLFVVLGISMLWLGYSRILREKMYTKLI